MSDPSLATTIGGLQLDCCLYNASGPRTGSIDALMKIGQSQAGAILAKSATLVKQDGNPMPRFVNKIDLGVDNCLGSMNSEGLPNYGIHYYLSEEAEEKLTVYGKPYIISISGLSLVDNLVMLEETLKKSFVSSIELNLACPNIPNKPIIAYDFDQMETVLQAITKNPNLSRIPLGVKLAPYFDVPHFQRVIDIIIKYPAVKYLVTCNTIGNGLLIDYERETTMIAPKNGFGGLGGGYIKPIALSNVRMLFTLLQKHGRNDIDIVGVGGVASGKDAFELILCGAAAVQIGTCHWTEGPTCFQRVASELKQIMQSKGYSNIQQFKGKLKNFDEMKSSKTVKSSTIKSLKSLKSNESIGLFGLSFQELCKLELVVIIGLLSIIIAIAYH